MIALEATIQSNFVRTVIGNPHGLRNKQLKQVYLYLGSYLCFCYFNKDICVFCCIALLLYRRVIRNPEPELNKYDLDEKYK